jgi:hypothetical protein
VAEKEKTCTYSVQCRKDLSTTWVKVRLTCYLLRVDDKVSISQIISMFGISAVVGVHKKPPAMTKKLLCTDSFVSCRGGVQRLDVINLVDVTLNDDLPRLTKAKVTFNARGRKGIDLIYFPHLHSLKLTVRYKQYVVSDTMEKLNDIGIGLESGAAPLTDDELEAMIRG